MSSTDDIPKHPMESAAPIPLRWAAQIMEMVSRIKDLYPQLFEGRRYWYTLPD